MLFAAWTCCGAASLNLIFVLIRRAPVIDQRHVNVVGLMATKRVWRNASEQATENKPPAGANLVASLF